MGRAAGKHNQPRNPSGEPGITDTYSEDAKYAQDAPRQTGQTTSGTKFEKGQIPGGRAHITNPETVRHSVPVPQSPPEHRGILAHGVKPDEHTFHERAEAMRGPNDLKQPAPAYKQIPQKPIPVPVYIVEENAGANPLRTAITRHILVPSFNSADPVLICGVDPKRTKIRLANFDSTNQIRIAQSPTALAPDWGSASPPTRSIGGSILPKSMASYQDFETSDELWAINFAAAGVTVELQIIMETSVPGAG